MLRGRRANAHLLVKFNAWTSQRLMNWNPIPKLTFVLIWKTPSCLKFDKTSNRAVENMPQRKQRTMHALTHRTSSCFYMYFPLLFQVISRSCFRFTPAAPTIVHSVLQGCPDWPVISIYTLRCLLSTIHARSSIQFIHLSGLHPSPLTLPPRSRLLQVSSLLSYFRP